MARQAYKREYPRVTATIPVEVRTSEGAVLRAATSNISRAGLQLTCDRATAATLLPAGLQPPLPGERIEVRVQLELPLPGLDPAPVTAHGTTVFLRRVAENDFRVGVQFTAFEGQSYHHLERYIDHTTTGG